MSHFIEFDNVSKVYDMGEVKINALSGASFTIEKGELCVVVGPSGAGKTTLLNILGGMDSLTSGRVLIDGEEISAYPRRKLTTYRRYDVGFVFQFYNLIQNLTALENVEMATEICRNPLDPAEVIEHVGLKDRAKNFPASASPTFRRSFRAASSRGCLSQGRLQKIPSFFCATSRRARLIT